MGALDLTNNLSEASDEIKNLVNHVGVGLAKLDYEDFLKGNYFQNGHIYIDEEKATYKALDFGSKGVFSLFGMLSPSMYMKAYDAKKRGIVGNMKGDGTQLGGTLIVDKEGNVIYAFKQKDYADEPKFDDIVKSIKEYSQKI